MSQTETHVGKLTIIKANENETLIELAERILKEENAGLNNEDPFTQLREDFYDKYFIYNETIYKIEDKELDEDDICQGALNEDSSIDYVVQFYNGGTCLSEMLEEVVKKATK